MQLCDKLITAKLCSDANMRCHEVWLRVNLKILFSRITQYFDLFDAIELLNGSDLIEA